MLATMHFVSKVVLALWAARVAVVPKEFALGAQLKMFCGLTTRSEMAMGSQSALTPLAEFGM